MHITCVHSVQPALPVHYPLPGAEGLGTCISPVAKTIDTADHGHHFTSRLAISLPPPGSSMPHSAAANRLAAAASLRNSMPTRFPQFPSTTPARDRCFQPEIRLTQGSARPTASTAAPRPSPAAPLCVAQSQGKLAMPSNRADGTRPRLGRSACCPAARGRCQSTLDVT